MKLTFLLTALVPSTTWGADSYSPYGNLCKDVPYKTSADVIKNLNSFSNLYVKFGNCAYSAQYNANDEEHHGGGEEGWYKGFQYTRGANVAFSLYGGSSLFGGCGSSTFINSFYTLDGLASFASATGVSVSSVPSNVSVKKSYQNERGNNEYYYACTNALTCGQKDTFVAASFSDGMCHPSGYSATTDTLDSLNRDLSKKDCVKISTETALTLLTYSETCTTLSGPQCPDPHGILEECEQTYQAFDKFIQNNGIDVTKPGRFFLGFVLMVVAFLIYGFALLKKLHTEYEMRDQIIADLVVEKGVSAEKAESLVKPAPTEYHPLSIQNAAISFARSVSMAAKPAIDRVKYALEDEDEEKEEINNKSGEIMNQDYVPPVTPESVVPVTQEYVAPVTQESVAPVTQEYVPPVTQEYVGETSSSSATNRSPPRVNPASDLNKKKKSKKGVKKVTRFFSRLIFKKN